MLLFPLRSIHAEPKESLQCTSVKIIHRQIQKGSTKKLWGSSEESWYSWINKKACPLSLIAPSQWQTPSWQRVSCPAPAHYSDNICHNSICAQSRSGTCWLVDTRPVFFFFFFLHFLIPPYVSTAHMTSLPSHLLHPDTITHFFCLFFFFPFPFSDWENGKGRGGEGRRTHSFSTTSHTRKKKNPRPAGSSHFDDITLCWNRYTFRLFSLRALSLFFLLVDCWCGPCRYS